MKTEVHSPARLTDDQLLVHVKALAVSEREATARLIAALAELDARRLYLGEGYSSLADLEKKKLGKTARPRRALAPLPRTSRTLRSRHVPADVKREVLELHHVIPFADGGLTTVANLQLRCRAHNAYEAEQWSGDLPLLVREDGVPYGLGLDRVWPARVSRARTALPEYWHTP